MSVSHTDADDMQPRTPGDRWIIPTSLGVAAVGGLAMTISLTSAIVESACLLFLIYAITRLDQSRCELSYWHGRVDENEWQMENRRRHAVGAYIPDDSPDVPPSEFMRVMRGEA